MPGVSIIGLGLNDEKGISLEGLDEAKRSNLVFAEFYTNTMPRLNLDRLESLIGRRVRIIGRTQLEDENGAQLSEAANKGSVALLVPGDPLIATTHVSLRITLSKLGIETRIFHAASIMSAVCGATGLQSYKFGKSVTIPRDDPLPNSVIDTISENSIRGLHTLLLLDVKTEKDVQLTIKDYVAKLLRTKPDLKDRLAVGAARVGARDEMVRASNLHNLMQIEFGDLPHCIVIPGKLHFMEAEALKVLSGAKDEDLREKA